MGERRRGRFALPLRPSSDAIDMLRYRIGIWQAWVLFALGSIGCVLMGFFSSNPASILDRVVFFALICCFFLGATNLRRAPKGGNLE